MPLNPKLDPVAMSQMEDDPDYDPERAPMEKVRGFVGGYGWPADQTRPDLCFSRMHFARCQSNCSATAFAHMKDALRYISRTVNYGVGYCKGTSRANQIFWYVDTDFMGCKMTRRSVYTIIGILNGGPFYWKTKLIPGRPCHSTLHAESHGCVHCTHEAIYHAALANDMGFTQELPIKIYCDNKEAVEMANSGKVTQSNKHFENRCHQLKFLTDTRRPGGPIVNFEWVSTKENPADVGTKAMLDVDQYEMLRDVVVTPKPGTDAFAEYLQRMRRAVSLRVL